MNIISPFCDEAVQRDADALAALMRHLKEIDSDENTVIAIQIENEIGLLGSDRDYSEAAEKLFLESVPEEIAQEYAVSGTWEECFSDDASEMLMCLGYAKAIEKLAQSAQQAYPLPCYANAWLKQFPWYAGSYPSGGPVATMHRIWKRCAPSLFCLAPDIYVQDVPRVMEEYTYDSNPLFIPEIRKDAVTASYALYAFGQYHAIGYSPFAVEELSMNPDDVKKPPMEVMAALNIDPSAFDIRGSKEYLAAVYQFIENVKPLYFDSRAEGRLQSYLKKSETDFGTLLRFKKHDILVSYAPRQSGKPLSAGWVIELDENRFYLIGMMSTFKILSKPGVRLVPDIATLEEGVFENGVWKAGRQLNGDERMMLRLDDRLSCFYLELYQYGR